MYQRPEWESGGDLLKVRVRQRSPYPPLRKTTKRGRWKELDESELCEGIASALTKGVYGRSDRKTVD